MKHKIVGTVGLILLVLGVGLIVLQIREGEKTILQSIASGFTPVFMGTLLLGLSRWLERKMAAADRVRND